MGINLFVTSTFLAAIFCVAALYSLASDVLFRDRVKLRARIEEELRSSQRARAKNSMLKQMSQAELHQLIDAAEDHRTWHEKIRDMIDQAGLQLAPAVLYRRMAGAGILVLVLAFLIRQSIPLAILAGAFACCLPLLQIRMLRDRRQNNLRAQLADAFELMSSTLRAGQSMTQSMQAVAVDFPAPIAEEFMLCAEQQNLGLDPEISMRQLARRCGIIELKIFVVAVLVQKQVGGNLSEILQGLAHVVRERFRIMGLINTLTAEGRLQALVLMALPPFLLVAMIWLNRDYTQSLLDHPELLVGMALSMGLGWLWIRKIINFDF